MAGLNHQLKDKLREQAPTGKVTLGSGDIAGERSQVMAPSHGPVKAAVPKIADQDPLVNAADPAAPKLGAEAFAEDGAGAKGDITPEDPLSFGEDEVELTEAERDAFLDAVMKGRRYEQRFSLFGGRVTGKLRSRSTEESEAVAAHLNNGVREGVFTTPLDYSVAVRNAMLAAQVAELNGTTYSILQQPLFRTRTGEAVAEPGWVSQAQMWSTDPKLPESVVAAVYEELRIFERKYWTMIAHANDQNFWQTAGSISK